MTRAMPPPRRQSLRQIFAIPLLLALLGAVGLVGAYCFARPRGRSPGI